MTININEVDHSLSELNIAIKDHYDWAAKMLRLSLIGGDADKDIMHPTSHQHCRFSTWLKRRIEMGSLDNEMVIAIDQKHTIMHEVARQLMHSIIAKNASVELVTRYHDSQQAFINSLDSYKQYLFNWRNLHDALTGLPLRHLLYQEFPVIRSQSQEMGHGLYVLLMDIDRFKSINDTWGHNAGDDVLRNVALTLQSATRKTERIYRFGGEEFVVLLNALSDEDAQTAASRMRRNLEQQDIMVNGQAIRVTVTGGLTKIGAQDTLHCGIGRADKAMYHGKTTGRNRCVMASAQEEMHTFG